MSDWNLPGLASEYSDFRDLLKDQLDNLAKMDFEGDTNLPTGTVRRNPSTYKLEYFTGATWASTPRETALDAHIADSALHGGTPIGAVAMWPLTTAPDNWLLCNGQAVSRATYATLFSRLSTTYGAGDGSTTFNVPDYRGYMPIMRGTTGTANQAPGAKFGAVDHTHTGPSHTHTAPSHAHSMQSHTHAGAAHSHTLPNHQHTVPGHSHDSRAAGADIAIGAGGAHQHGIPKRNNVSGFSNAGESFGSVSPAFSGNYDIKTETAGAHSHANTDFAGRVGNVSGGVNGDGSFLTSTGGGGGATSADGGAATGTPSVADTSSVGLTTDAAGNGATGANNPPCVVMNFIIKGL